MFYMIFIPIIIFLILQIFHFLELRKHDKSLYEFCQLRRDTISYLNDNYKNLSRNDYVAIRKLLSSLNKTIHNYQKHKTTLFNVRRFERYVKEFLKSGERTERISTNNPQILELIERMRFSVFTAFLSYTPFLRSELTIKLLLYFLNFLGRSSKDRVIEAIKIIRNQNFNSNMGC